MRDGIDVAIQELNDRVIGGEKITTEMVKKVLHRTGAKVTGQLIGGPDIETKHLPEGMRNNRLAMGRISEAVAAKYAYEIAVQLGIEKEAPPATAPEKAKKPGFSIGNDILEKYTPLGTLGKRIDQATKLVKGE